ncbi:retropepsin-like aspartic protease family protein [Teredinibacter waterburyi]|jgi:clan AA aspartic protease, TIGR02281 family|uniref:retropepsin-like aspartic protease family protein n=1 Tax=Teredinibacter waterburyi TaxID=1500538 RepID=UPI00165FC221|nr:retropepsin-like aspartic protease [Teredinibacter waterburyi]
MSNQPSTQQPGKKLGKGMLYAFWLMALIGLTLFFQNRDKQRYNPNQDHLNSLGGVPEVILESNAYHHYVATGLINGHPVTFLLDTGATQVAIPAHLQNLLQLKPRGFFKVGTANGTVEVRGTTIDLLELGPIRLSNVRAALNPGMTGDEILLGMSALKQLEFTQKGNRLIVRQPL